MLQHKFVIEWADGQTETRTSTLELFGDPMKYSGMSLSVGVTCGIATQPLLDGHKAFTTPGVIAPYTPAICNPICEKLELEGVKMVEKTL
ncbi:Saccharopine dehydrogenase [NADP(+),L-glutamate-forming] [Lachnellula willkommii]|uniref:Saccharopine dehydrogenase [NADP(+),L-glutamate-forming] n=1 Tax=Lachnellula willkommii TaxID=215461 RepID=A0A559ME49_9HELO|nr:Saccharopine dehydrogenase [NADP(+),L-glutamate-forming] [Lachnellula willkommii]